MESQEVGMEEPHSTTKRRSCSQMQLKKMNNKNKRTVRMSSFQAKPSKVYSIIGTSVEASVSGVTL